MRIYTVDKGGEIEPKKFVVRWRGLLVRDDKQLPILYDTYAEADAEANRLEAEENEGNS